MKVLVLGKGGREHALCWRLKRSESVDQVFCAPGNGGTAADARNVPIDTSDFRALTAFAKRESIDLTIVGPEQPLVEGIVDHFQREGLAIFGPRKEAAELEGSKVFAKELMRSAGIPTAEHRVFRTAPDAEAYILSRDVTMAIRSRGRSSIRNTLMCRTAFEAIESIDRIFDPRETYASGIQVEIEERQRKRVFDTPREAKEYVLSRPLGLVIKADGLAGGKGVYVCDRIDQAIAAIDQLMVRRIYGKAGDRILIEEKLDGREVSILALTDGRTIIPLETCQDHKRAHDGDEGPNTGGMGAYSPAPTVDRSLFEQIEREVLVPAVHAMKRARRPFRGVLYAGLMLTSQGPRVLEFNVRLGDPEAQALLMRLKGDLGAILAAVTEERLEEIVIEWDPRPAVTVVIAAEGYPGSFEKGRPIHNLEEAGAIPDVKVFHSGTTLQADVTGDRESRLVTDGGRVLSITALGDTLELAREKAYQAARSIRLVGGWFRSDIALN